jgi:hypothetical protein
MYPMNRTRFCRGMAMESDVRHFAPSRQRELGVSLGEVSSWHKKFTVIAICHTFPNSKPVPTGRHPAIFCHPSDSVATQNRTYCQLLPSALGNPANQ